MSLRVGFLGYRFMGEAHANALARLPMFFPDAPDVDRAVLVGRDEAALADAAARLGFDTWVTDWRDALDDVDVLYNLGPNALHVEPSVEALRRGVHVLAEKPLAGTLDGAEEMARAAAESDAVAGCGFNYRFLPAIRVARSVVERGELGEIRHIRGRYLQDWLVDQEAAWTWRNSADLAGSGALGDLGAHSFDLAKYLVGDRTGPIRRVSGHLQTFVEERPAGDTTRPVTVDDAFSAQVEFENGSMGTFEATRVADGHKNDQTIELSGSEGSLRFSLERLNELKLKREDGRGYETVLVTDEDDPYLDAWWPPGLVLGWEHSVVHENYEFLRAAETGGSFAPDFQDALTVQRVLDAVERSHDRGEWVEV